MSEVQIKFKLLVPFSLQKVRLRAVYSVYVAGGSVLSGRGTHASIPDCLLYLRLALKMDFYTSAPFLQREHT